MTVPFQKKRFRINPIELAILGAMGLIFVKSGYSLLASRDGFEPTALTATAQDPIATSGTSTASNSGTNNSGDTNGRSPASVSKSFTEMKIGCDPSVEMPTTNSNKIRFIGSLCKPGASPAEFSKGTSAQAANKDKNKDDDEDYDKNVADDDSSKDKDIAQGATQNNAAQTKAVQPAVASLTEESAANVKKISVINTSAKVAATVFPDYSNQKFSTDYMTLTQGKNLIYVQYEYKDGKTLGQEFSVIKN